MRFRDFLLVAFCILVALFPVAALAQDDPVAAVSFWPNLLAWLVSNGGTVLGAVTAIVGGFAIIATLTPNTSDDKIVDFILKAVNFLGANVGKARNDPAKK